MNNLSVKHLLAAAQGMMLFALLVVAATGILTKLQVMESLHRVDEIAAQQVAAINRAEINLMELKMHLGRFNEYRAEGDATRAQDALGLARAALERAVSRFEQFAAVEVPSNAQRAPTVEEIKAHFHQLVTSDVSIDLASGNLTAIMGQRDRMNDAFEPFADAVRRFNQQALSLSSEEIRSADHLHTLTMIVSGVLIAFALLLSLGVQMSINRLIVRPLQRAVALCEHIAKGDLTSHIESRGNNEIGRLYSAMRDMQGKLQAIVETLMQSSNAVAASSRQMASGSQDLASRTEEQAAALQQTAASMDEISSIVRQNADTAAQAERLTQEASAKAARGKQESEQTSVLMRELEASSQQVNEIVQVIDSIAFQTNILALNASVEAARAGEHGRGFAVVASEVRSLATKTATSSKEIRTMIEDIAGQIAQGADQALRNGESMDDINQAIVQVNDMMQALALAAKEQESGIRQISTAIAEMDSTTQENVSLVEETSTASASLQDEAGRLDELVSAFKLQRLARSLADSPLPQVIQQTFNTARASLMPAPASTRTTITPEWEAF